MCDCERFVILIDLFWLCVDVVKWWVIDIFVVMWIIKLFIYKDGCWVLVWYWGVIFLNCFGSVGEDVFYLVFNVVVCWKEDGVFINDWCSCVDSWFMCFEFELKLFIFIFGIEFDCIEVCDKDCVGNIIEVDFGWWWVICVFCV